MNLVLAGEMFAFALDDLIGGAVLGAGFLMTLDSTGHRVLHKTPHGKPNLRRDETGACWFHKE